MYTKTTIKEILAKLQNFNVLEKFENPELKTKTQSHVDWRVK